MAWFNNNGNMQSVVISTRVRLARNLNGYPFASRLDDRQADEIIERVSSALPEYSVEKFFDANTQKILSYMEMHDVSPEFAASHRHRALLTGMGSSVKIMVCEEDHLRIQSIVAGFDPEKAYEYAISADAEICKKLDIAYSEKYGYLTHCPTNLGAAMRVSAMLCLPALSGTRAFDNYVKAAGKMGITVRGIYGENSRASGKIYQISNRASLGVDCAEIIRMITEAVTKLVQAEEKARTALYEAGKPRITDRVARNVGILKNAHVLSSSEVNESVAELKLGLSQGIIKGITDSRITEMLIACQPATISMLGEGLDNELERDIKRASLVRDMLGDVTVEHV